MADYRFPGEHIYKGMVLTDVMREDSIKKIEDMEAVDGDILIAGYPKTGTNWLKEIVWLVRNNADVETAFKIPHKDRVWFLEQDQRNHENRAGIDLRNDVKRPTIMMTHLPANYLANAINASNIKVIVQVRNPKDTLVSLYHFYRMNRGLGNFSGTWDEFFELYKSKHVVFGDYCDWYETWLPFLDHENVELYKYEDMKTDIRSVIARLAKYLGNDLKEDQIQEIMTHTSFGNMKSNKLVNVEENVRLNAKISSFFRKGEVGNWKNYFTSEQNRVVDQDYKARLESKGLVLEFE